MILHQVRMVQILFLVVALLLPWQGFGQELRLSPLRWGLNLKELNRVYQEQINPQGN